MNSIETFNLTKKFKNRMAVDSLNLSVKTGEFFSLLGQNGAGKTTTIKMLCCLLNPSSGDAMLLGDSIIKNSTVVKQKLNVSPQETAIAPNLSVKENLELIARIYGSNKNEAKEKTEDLIKKFGLYERVNDKAKTLSGGMKRRLSIAMALISDPKIIFLDEPTLGLDVRARHELWNILKNLKGKITIILTTHYLEEAEALSDRIGIMNNGKLGAIGTAEELKKKADKNTFEEAFLYLTESEVIS